MTPTAAPRRFWLLPALASLLVLLCSTGWWNGVPPLGDDASSHISTIGTLAERMRAGEGWWSTDYNLGFPMALYYQPIPHVVSAALCALIGGADHAATVYRVLVLLLTALLPWCVTLGWRRAGAPLAMAACTGLLTPLVMESLAFGFNSHATLKVGLYTQVWGMAALPLWMGEMSAWMRGRGRWLPTAATTALAMGCHTFLIVALPPALGLALLVQALRQRRPTVLAAPTAAAALGMLALAPWWLTLWSNRAAMGGWPFGSEEHRNGFGLRRLGLDLVSGRWMDGPTAWSEWLIVPLLEDGDPRRWGIRVVPVLSILALGGLLRLRRSALRGTPTATVLGCLVAWALFGAAGRTGLGAAYDLWPLHRSVEAFRYSLLVQFAGLGLAGLGLAELGAALHRALDGRSWRPAPAAAVVGLVTALLLVQPTTAGIHQLRQGFRTIDHSLRRDTILHRRLGETLRDLPEGGRVMIGPRTGTRYHFHGGLMAWLGRRPMGQSYGVGLHDSLGFYVVQYADLQDPARTATWLQWLDYRWIVRHPDTELAGLPDLPVHWSGGRRYRVHPLPVDGQSAMVVHVLGDRIGSPRALREDMRRWWQGEGPGRHATWRVQLPSLRDGSDLVGAPHRVQGRDRVEDTLPPLPARVITSHARADRASATVEVDGPAWLAFRMAWHPFWSVTVDGSPREVHLVYPAFPAVRLQPGDRQVEARFRWPDASRRAWPWTGILWLLALGMDLRARRRNPPPANGPPAEPVAGPAHPR
jgi:hypothetical protein